MEKLVVQDSNDRIDKYLASNTDYSRLLITKLIDNEFVLVNGNKVKSSYKVKENDEIEILDGYTEETDIIPVHMDLDIVYEDKYQIAVKVPGILQIDKLQESWSPE